MNPDSPRNQKKPEEKRLWAETIKKFRGTFANGGCFICGSPAIRSHTLSKSTYLQHIAEGDHVLSWSMGWWTTDPEDFFQLKPIGINEASTFPGFCADHDSALFRPLDFVPFQATREQLFLQAFRAHAREVHCKKSQIEMIPDPELIAKLGGLENPESYVSSPQYDLQNYAADLGLRDTLFHHRRLDALRAVSDHSRLEHCVITLEAVESVIACAGSFYPEILPNGTELQDFSDEEANLETIHFSILPNGTGAYVVFSFLDTESASPRALVNAILSHSRAADLIAWMAFTYVENTFLRPSWGYGLDPAGMQAVRTAFEHNNSWTSADVHTLSAMPDAFSICHKVVNHFWM